MQKDKIPEPDGWPMEFFNGFMDLFETNLLVVITKSRINETKTLVAAFNAIFITLIPKVDNVTKWEEYRPISLCNYIYKLISRVIARRMKTILCNSVS